MFFRMVYKSRQISLSFCQGSRVWRTDRQTDRQTDRILIARPRLHCMQRGKKCFPAIGVWPLGARPPVSSLNMPFNISEYYKYGRENW